MTYVGVAFNHDAIGEFQQPFKTGGYGYLSMNGRLYHPNGFTENFGEKFGAGRSGDSEEDILTLDFDPKRFVLKIYKNDFLMGKVDCLNVEEYRFVVSSCGQKVSII